MGTCRALAKRPPRTQQPRVCTVACDLGRCQQHIPSPAVAKACYAVTIRSCLTLCHSTPSLLQAVLYGIFPAVAAGAAVCWLRMGLLRQLSAKLHRAFEQRKEVASSGSVSVMQGLNAVHRWRDAQQVSFILRDMRVWDEDGAPDPQAAEFGEFVIKVRTCCSSVCKHTMAFKCDMYYCRQQLCHLDVCCCCSCSVRWHACLATLACW